MKHSKLTFLFSVTLILAACSPTPEPATSEPASPAVASSATVSSSCPNLTMTATVASPPSREVTITASVESPPADVAYMWNVSAGSITAGQGSASITVDPPIGEPVVATVEVMPVSCFGSANIEVP